MAALLMRYDWSFDFEPLPVLEVPELDVAEALFGRDCCELSVSRLRLLRQVLKSSENFL
ncbi:hypothetical protein D3C87_2189040 [compost metagenome]